MYCQKTIRTEIFKLLHEHKTSAYHGPATTHSKIQANFYWPNYKVDMALWCKTCKTCEITNAKVNPKRAPLQPKPSFRRMDRIAVDIMKVPTNEEGVN